MKRALAHGRHLTGEHGIGQIKSPLYGLGIDRAALDVMRAVKRAIDPDNIMNPGKALPDF